MVFSDPTPLIRLPEIEQRYGVGRIYLKDESVNPYGSIKDRRNSVILAEAAKFRVDKLVLITSGNSGYSLAKFAAGGPVKVICVVNRRLNRKVKNSLEQIAYQVIEHNLDHKILRPEEIIGFAREREDEVIWEVTNGYEDAYGTVVNEIFSEVEPTHIVVPVGSGGIYMGFVQAIERRRAGTVILGVGPRSTISSVADKLTTPWTPYAKALEHYEGRGNKIIRISEEVIKRTFSAYKHQTVVEPSSSVVFAAFEEHTFGPQDKVVLINSGKSKVD